MQGGGAYLYGDWIFRKRVVGGYHVVERTLRSLK